MTTRANSLTERVTTQASTGSTLTIPARDLRVFLDAFERLGYHAGALLASAGLGHGVLDHPDARVPCEAVGALVSCAQQRRFTPNLALALARLTPMGAWLLLDYLVLTSDTVGAGVRQLAHYFRLTGNAIVLDVHEDTD